MENYYKLLGVPEYCDDQEAIKKAYRQLVKYYHPDSKNVSPEIAEEKTKQINMAYDVLSNPSKKAQYDQQLRYGFSSNQTYTNPNPNQSYQRQSFYGFSPFPGGFFYSSGGPYRGGSYRRGFSFIRIVIIYLLISFLFRMCTVARYNYYYDDYYYPGYRGYQENKNIERAPA